MRYFEIVNPSTKHKLSDTEQREPTAGNPRFARMKSAGNRADQHFNPAGAARPNQSSRRRQLVPPAGRCSG